MEKRKSEEKVAMEKQMSLPQPIRMERGVGLGSGSGSGLGLVIGVGIRIGIGIGVSLLCIIPLKVIADAAVASLNSMKLLLNCASQPASQPASYADWSYHS